MSQPVLLSMGTRPEIIKMAPVYRAMHDAHDDVKVLHTGQHDSMAWPLYEFFGMRPHVAMVLDRDGGTLAHLSATLLSQSQSALERLRPGMVLVHGDTTSAAMMALAAFYNQIPVGHVEAGLRSGQPYDPFPEEKNRELIGRIAHWHFAPTRQAVRNLRNENVADTGIHLVGNTVVDATRWAAELLDGRPDQGHGLLPGGLKELPAALESRRLLLVTAHRRENWGPGIARIASAVMQLVMRHPQLLVVWPVHANPLVSDAVRAAAAVLDDRQRRRLWLTEPLNYPAMMLLMRRAWLVLTDSGGMQEEALSHRVPVLVLRETTERPELLEAGAGLLVGTQAPAIIAAVDRLLHDAAAYDSLHSADNPFGDGRSGQRIGSILRAARVDQRQAA